MAKKIEIMIEDYGVKLGKKSERLIVKNKNKVVNEVPLFDLSEISILSRGVSLSTDLIWECTKRGIPINFLLRNGEPYANLMGTNLQGTVKTRRAQLFAFEDERGVKIAKAIAVGKLSNQQAVIKYFSKYRKNKDINLYNQMAEAVDLIGNYIEQIQKIDGKKINDIRGGLMAYEGLGSKTYWSVFGMLLPEGIEFRGRITRGSTDLVNSLLNYGYGILYSKIWGAIIKAGLDPFGGFIHVDRPGKPSLVLDFIEEFRQTVVDRTILANLNKGVKFEIDSEGLSLDTQKELAKKINERLDSKEKYNGQNQKLKTIIQRQARHMAVALRGEGEYIPFISRW